MRQWRLPVLRRNVSSLRWGCLKSLTYQESCQSECDEPLDMAFRADCEDRRPAFQDCTADDAEAFFVSHYFIVSAKLRRWRFCRTNWQVSYRGSREKRKKETTNFLLSFTWKIKDLHPKKRKLRRHDFLAASGSLSVRANNLSCLCKKGQNLAPRSEKSASPDRI